MLDQATRLREMTDLQSFQPSAGRPHLITVTSGKGGVGKSTVALNLAIALSDSGKSVLLVDGDGNLGGLDTMLGISPEFRLGHILRAEKEIPDVVARISRGLSVLPGSSGEVGYPFMTPEQQARLMHDLIATNRQTDFLLIDTAAGLTPEIVGYAVHADETIVVTTPEPTAVMDAYAVIKMILLARPLLPVKLIVNQAHTLREADGAAEKLQLAVDHFLKKGIMYLGSIPSDARVSEAIVRQRPLVRIFPKASAALSLQRMAEQLALPVERLHQRKAEAV